MRFAPLPFRSALSAYERQADELLEDWRAGDPDAVQFFRNNLPRFLDERVPWLPKKLTDEELRSVQLELGDALLALAHDYSFQDWSRLAKWVEACARTDSAVGRFEAAVEAVITGDTQALERLLEEDPELVRARSTIVTHHDPPVHGATLLHYIAANGVEGFRQRTPPNAVEIARLLLEAGAEPDALADMYGGRSTTMSMLVSSTPPAEAGVQVALVELLVDHGAAVEPRGAGEWTSPLTTALAFGFRDAAEALVRRGASVSTLAAAAGLGRLADARRMLATASAEDRHRALALAAQHGQVEIVRLLLDAGEDPDRYNLKGNHAHSTPLHQAALAGHEAVVRLFVERGARLDIRDTLWEGTPLGWAVYGKRPEIASFLSAHGAQR